MSDEDHLCKGGLAAAALLAVLAAACGSPSPAARVHTAFSKAGVPAHSVQRSRDQIGAAKLLCKALESGTSYRAAVADATSAFYGDRAKATAFVDAVISSYCPQVKR